MFCLFVTVVLNGKQISLPKYRLLLTSTSAFLVAVTNPTTRSLNNVFILALSPGNVGEIEMKSNFTSQLREAALGTSLEIKVGFFGLCARRIGLKTWTCSSSRSSLVEALGPNVPDALNLLGMAEHFRTEVIFPGLT